MLLNTLVFLAQAESFFLPFVQDQLIREVVDHFVRVCLQLLKVEVFDALVTFELGSRVFLVANLAHYHNGRALRSDMNVQLLACEVLKFW